MIDWNKSAKLNKMSIYKLKSWFGKYPSSSRIIIRICDNCNEEKEIDFKQYRNLCHSCAMKQPKIRESARLKTIEQFSNPKARKIQSDKMVKYCNNPEIRRLMSEKMKQYLKDHPESGTENSARQIQYYIDNPEARKTMSKIRLNSDAAKAFYKIMVGGNDIIGHHIAYDFLRPKALVVMITRKFHSQIHHPKGCKFGTHGYSLID